MSTTPAIAIPAPICARRRSTSIATEAPVFDSGREPPRHAS